MNIASNGDNREKYDTSRFQEAFSFGDPFLEALNNVLEALLVDRLLGVYLGNPLWGILFGGSYEQNYIQKKKNRRCNFTEPTVLNIEGV